MSNTALSLPTPGVKRYHRMLGSHRRRRAASREVSAVDLISLAAAFDCICQSRRRWQLYSSTFRQQKRRTSKHRRVVTFLPAFVTSLTAVDATLPPMTRLGAVQLLAPNRGGRCHAASADGLCDLGLVSDAKVMSLVFQTSPARVISR